MGNIFPQIFSLKEKPSLFDKTITLIEKSFQYGRKNSFKIDFAPLIDITNLHNCFILVDEDENVLAHVGAKDRFIEINKIKFQITMLGGIAVDEKYRGQGLFQQLFQHVLSEKKNDSAFFLLWSDQEKLYSKYGFILCGHQYENSSETQNENYSKTTLSELNSAEFLEIKNLYETSFKNSYVSFERTDEDWEILKKITSSNLFIKKTDEKISSYFFKDKGQDLKDITFEYGSTNLINDILSSLPEHTKIWSAFPINENAIEQFQFLLAPADLTQFSSFIFEYSNHKINVRQINQMKQEIYFDFNQETLGLDLDEFMHGIFGPKSFEEIEDLKPIFISGLDSI
jgi:predicted N-acetyltransferase YhbS